MPNSTLYFYQVEILDTAVLIFVSSQPEADESKAYETTLEHLQIMRTKRKHYKTIFDECKHSVHTHFATNDIPPPPCSWSICNMKVHYLIQQVHYPSDLFQPGSIYFLTPIKCTVFGVAGEALSHQINFVTDEAGDCGKGANAVISWLDYFFLHHSVEERDMYLRADNCTSQSKNNCMMGYLAWHMITNRYTTIMLLLAIQNLPRSCFGLFKRSYRKMKVWNLLAIARVINTSANCKFLS